MLENLSLIIFSGQAVVYSIVNNSHFFWISFQNAMLKFIYLKLDIKNGEEYFFYLICVENFLPN